MKDPYEILGMPYGSAPEALQARYEELKRQYSEQRFEDGARGNEGARLLSELETCWAQIQMDLRKSESKRTYGGDYGEVESMIRAGKYDDAQSIMDTISDRDAKWHYYQSIVFYKREWLSESRAQLVIALQMDPNNAKYKESLRKIDMVMGNAGATAQDIGGSQQGPYTSNQQYQQTTNQGADNLCANCVCAYCMTELCCTMTRICH